MPQLAEAVNANVQQRLRVYESLKSDKALLEKICTIHFSEKEYSKLIQFPFFFYVYDGSNLIFWNSNEALSGSTIFNKAKGNDTTRHDRNIFFTTNDTVLVNHKQYTISLLMPLAWIYPFENDYVQSHWEASPLIPASTQVLLKPEKGTYPIYNLEHKPIFYLKFHAEDVHYTTPARQTVLLTLLAALASILWLQLIALHISRHRSKWAGSWFAILLPVIIRGILYKTGLPFHLNELKLFSPQLYASSYLLASLGDLLLNTICLTWMCIFILLERPRWVKKGLAASSGITKTFAFTGLLIAFSVCIFFCSFVISSLVIDSNISFDLSHYNNIDGYTIVALVNIALLLSITGMMLYYLNHQMNKTGIKKWIKYLLVAVCCVACFFLLKDEKESFYFYLPLIGWTIIFLLLLDFRKITVSSEVFSPSMILWAVFICASGAFLLQFFSDQKEHENRKKFASKLVGQNDPYMQFIFQDIAPDIQYDEALHAFLKNPTPEGRNLLNDRLDVFYLEHLNKYQLEVYLFDANNNPLFNADTVDINTFYQKTTGIPSDPDSMLFFKEDAQDGHNYTARIPVYNDTSDALLGTMYIDFSSKKVDNETVYPELLQPSNVRQLKNEQAYAYAIYHDTMLATQTNNYPFEVIQSNIPKGNAEYTFQNENGYSLLWYHADRQKTVLVVYRPEKIESIARLFSFLFGAQLLISLLYIIYQAFLRYLSQFPHRFRLHRLPLNKRIQFTVLGVGLLSFVIIGIATPFVLAYQYDKSTNARLLSIIQFVENNVVQYLNTHHGTNDIDHFNDATGEPSFKYFIANLANQQRADINVFDQYGILNATSQAHIYDKNLLAPIMNPNAYHELFDKHLSSLTQTENIGELYYRSSYMPIRNAAGLTLGYINVPYFSSEKELKDQISTLISTLINVYAIIFLLSGIIAYLFTQNLTKSLNMIIAGFNQINLAQNKPLQWPYEDDEIGKLVHAYNRMVRKVEDQAMQLAHNEREGAWREMARQVAHEIKNPLTPMKLKIQYLQRAIINEQPDVTELAAKVSASLIEQIDSLSYIASEFSNFAKMPEDHPVEIELNSFIEKQIPLYNREHLEIELNRLPQPLVVYMDQNQLLRILTNLFQNAIQAIPEEREGKIVITLSREDKDVLIAIADNGNGISEEARERIFKPYFTTKSSGTGLGLAMTRKMIEVAKGSIWFESVEDEGTTFFIRLPLVR